MVYLINTKYCWIILLSLVPSPGKYVKQGQVLRAKAQLEALQTQIASVARKTGISSATKLALIAPQDGNDGGIPNTEWWDAVIISGER